MLLATPACWGLCFMLTFVVVILFMSIFHCRNHNAIIGKAEQMSL